MVIHWELCKMTKILINDICTNLENKLHKLLFDFELQIDHLIPAIRQDRVIVNKIKEPAVW